MSGPETKSKSNWRSVECQPMSFFMNFENIGEDKLNNSILLPVDLLDELGVDEFDYVKVRPESSEKSIKLVAQALRASDLRDDFSDKRDNISDDLKRDGEYVGTIRTNMLKKVYRSEEVLENKIEVQACQTEDGFGESAIVYPEYADNTEDGFNCYLPPSRFENLSIEEGTHIEAYSSETGRRIGLETHKWNPKWGLDEIEESSEQVIGIDGYSRQLLGIEPEDLGRKKVKIRRCVCAKDISPKLREKILKPLVGYNTLQLRVEPGLNRDEYKNVARIHPDVLESLGMEEGDIAIIEWNGQLSQVRCLPKTDDTNENPLTIDLPHTKRDDIGVNIGDCIHIRRDMEYVIRKQMAFSVLGILAIIIGGLKLVELFRNPPTLVNIASVAFLLLALSLLVIWFIFYPERQKCP